MLAASNHALNPRAEIHVPHRESGIRMVVDTLEPMDVGRRAYRLVGGVLVERTVGEVLPTVKANQEGIKQLIQQLGQTQAEKEKAAAEWKVKFRWYHPLQYPYYLHVIERTKDLGQFAHKRTINVLQFCLRAASN